MKRFVLLATVVLAALVTAPVASPGGSAARATVTVVGSGPITWSHVGVRTRPSMSAPVITTLTQFRQDYRPRIVLALALARIP